MLAEGNTTWSSAGAALVAVAIVACSRVGDEKLAGSALARRTAVSVQGPVLTPGPSPRLKAKGAGLLWRRAAEGDPLDLQRLANREGADGLLLGISEGHTVGLTALRALPFARDRQLALGPVCRWLGAARPAERALFLDALYYMLSESSDIGESLDARGWAGCRASVRELDANSLTAVERDRVSSISQRLAREGGAAASDSGLRFVKP